MKIHLRKSNREYYCDIHTKVEEATEKLYQLQLETLKNPCSELLGEEKKGKTWLLESYVMQMNLTLNRISYTLAQDVR